MKFFDPYRQMDEELDFSWRVGALMRVTNLTDARCTPEPLSWLLAPCKEGLHVPPQPPIGPRPRRRDGHQHGPIGPQRRPRRLPRNGAHRLRRARHVNGAIHATDGVAAQAQQDLTTAYDVAAAQPVAPADHLTGQDLGGLMPNPGPPRPS
jgi:hypothetical protein